MAFGEESFTDLIAAWDGRGVVVHYDPPTGAWIFVALHDDTLGTPVGGCRMRQYTRPEEGLRDALRLAEGMTYKWAAMDFPFGGGKSVLALSAPLPASQRRGLLRRFGALLNSLRGAYGTGEDLGTTPEDMRTIAEVAPDHVVGLSPRGPTDPGPFTALGVAAGIEAALLHHFGDGSLEGRTVVVQGVGDVGEPLARLLAQGGASLLLADVDRDRAFAVAVEIGGSAIPPDEVYDRECDVYAPCAVGATLNADTIPRLRCAIVAGSANNQLETPDDARRLAARGILYAPDYVINGGGAMAFGLIARGDSDLDAVRQRVRGIGPTLREIFLEAVEAGETTVAAAERRALRVLARARTQRERGEERPT